MSAIHAAASSSPGGRALAGVIDQGFYSASNFLLTVLLAHDSSPTDFGIISIFLATFLVLSGINRGLNAESIIIRFSSSAHDVWRRPAQASFVRSIVLALPLAVVALGVLTFTTHGAPRAVGIALSLSLPIALSQDLLRYAALARGRPTAALRSDAIALVVQMIGSAIVLAAHLPTVWVVISWTAGTLLGGIGCLAQLGLASGLRPRVEHLRVDRLGRNLAADYFVTLLTQQGVVYVVASAAGLAAAGALRAAQVAFFIPTLLALGLQLAIVPELARKLSVSLDQLRATLKPITIGVVVLAAVSSAPVLFVPLHLGVSVFGASWDQARRLVVFVAAATMAMSLAVPAIAALRALAAGRITVIVRSSTLIVTLALTATGATVDGARGAAIGILISTAGQVGAWWIALGFAMRRYAARKRAVEASRLATTLGDEGEGVAQAEPAAEPLRSGELVRPVRQDSHGLEA